MLRVRDTLASLLTDLLLAAVLLGGAAMPGAHRAFQVLVFAAMLAALGITGWRLARWLAADWGAPSQAVAAFTFAVGLAVVPATWLGHFGWLQPAPFLVWVALALLASRWVKIPPSHPLTSPALLSHPSTHSRQGEEGEKPRQSSSVFVPLSPAGAGGRMGEGSGVRGLGGGWSKAEAAFLLAAGLAVALNGLIDMARLRWAPAGPYGFDDISYHLSAMAVWERFGDLRMMRFAVGDASTAFYPVLGEVSSWVLLAPFGDSDVVARWTQLFFCLASFLATAALARRLGLSSRSAGLAVVLFASIQRVFPILAFSAGNDHSTSFFTLAAVDGVLALARRPSRGGAVTVGAALGLLLATKYIGILYAAVLLGVLVLAALAARRGWRQEAGRPPILAAVLLLAAFTALAGGYTYLRNAVTVGNPVFPAPVSLFGNEILPGWEDATMAFRKTRPEFEIQVWDFLTRRRDLFGSLFPFTLLPAAVLMPFVALARRRWEAALIYALPAVFFLEFLFVMHDHRDMRYVLPGVALAAVAFAGLLEEIGPRVAVPLRAALLALVTWQAVKRPGLGDLRQTLLVLALAGLGILLLRAAERWRPPAWWGRWGRPAMAGGVVLLAAVPVGWAVSTYQEVKLADRPGPAALERLAGPAGARVAYVGFNQPYHYFGSRLQNDLRIVPRAWELDAQYYSWGAPVKNPFEAGTYRRWRRIVVQQKIKLVVVIRSAWEDPERQWIGEHPGDFRLAYQDHEMEIWRVLPDGRGARERAGGDHPRPGRRGAGRESSPAPGTGSNSSGRSRPAPG